MCIPLGQSPAPPAAPNSPLAIPLGSPTAGLSIAKRKQPAS